jgi:hypothetical protein
MDCGLRNLGIEGLRDFVIRNSLMIKYERRMNFGNSSIGNQTSEAK